MRIVLSAAVLLWASVVNAQPRVDQATMERWMSELSNWGRWGKTDQMGTVNLITPAKRRAAAALVKEGLSVSLSRDAETVKSAANPQPFGHAMISTGLDANPMFAMDTYTISYHGQSITHFDALSHMFHQGKVYNGYSQSEINTKGAGQLAVTAYKNGLVSRGILMDIPRLKGVPYLDPPAAILPADLDAWEKKAAVKVASGDIVLIRTGHWARRRAVGAWNTENGTAGMHPSCARWFHERGVSVVGSETHGEFMPSAADGSKFPLHQLLLIAMGTPLFDNCDLDALSEAAAARNRWEFLFVAAPLAVPGGTGSPLNPIAIF
ncbi:MAG: cyclase family protein [Candidatus Solibacter usitatus]|nr:cyclase family protein [Candidatus Solibacter usitatus]